MTCAADRYRSGAPCRSEDSGSRRSLCRGAIIGIFFYGHENMPPVDKPPAGLDSTGVTYVKGFREFLTRGNLVELAIAVVIGTAFTAVVAALVADLITPLIAAVVYFLIVKPMAALLTRLDRNKAATERDCPQCLSSIPIAATRCKYCTIEVTPTARQ